MTGLNRSVAQNLDYLPFGELNSTDSGITTHEFTGDESDAESGLDHTQFRQYSSSLARWMTPDPASLAAVNPRNPQSWNRYGYVGNSPLATTDPLGLTPVPFTPQPCGDTGCGGCTMDAIAMPCDLAYASVSSGAALICPNNICFDINSSNGLPLQFVASEAGEDTSVWPVVSGAAQ
jgi:RHS repeat-associated protein